LGHTGPVTGTLFKWKKIYTKADMALWATVQYVNLRFGFGPQRLLNLTDIPQNEWGGGGNKILKFSQGSLGGNIQMKKKAG